MEIEVKLTSLHAITAIISGYLSFIIATGAIGAIGKNEVLAVLLGLVILYFSGNISERLFGKEEVGGFKGWLWSGIVPFVFIWIVTWTLFLNW
jgi:EMC6-arch